MRAMIFAAGLGTRLKPITDTLPKALVPVGGQPLLFHVIRKLVSAGYDHLVVNVHHFPDLIIDYLKEHDFGVQVDVSDERDFLLETGGGIAHGHSPGERPQNPALPPIPGRRPACGLDQFGHRRGPQPLSGPGSIGLPHAGIFRHPLYVLRYFPGV